MKVRQPIPAEAFEHGDARRYRRGCRCAKCRAGANRSNIKNRYLRQTGRGTMRTPNRAADHLLLLRAAGLDDQTIQKQTSICPDVMYRILRREGTIHARTEARITRVSVPTTACTPTNRAYIPGHGTVRRLRALVAAGWYQAEIARRLGKQKENLRQIIIRGEDGQVAWYVAEQVRALYAELHDQKPEDHGVPTHFADRSRKFATDRGWAPPAYWDEDDLDNRGFKPATEATPRYIVLAENGLELEAQGHTRAQAAIRLGVSKDALQQSITRYRKALEEVAA